MCAQSCPTPCDPMVCSLPRSSVHGILQARILEWVAISSPRVSFHPGIKPGFPASPGLAGGFFSTESNGGSQDIAEKLNNTDHLWKNCTCCKYVANTCFHLWNACFVQKQSFPFLEILLQIYNLIRDHYWCPLATGSACQGSGTEVWVKGGHLRAISM